MLLPRRRVGRIDWRRGTGYSVPAASFLHGVSSSSNGLHYNMIGRTILVCLKERGQAKSTQQYDGDNDSGMSGLERRGKADINSM